MLKILAVIPIAVLLSIQYAQATPEMYSNDDMTNDEKIERENRYFSNGGHDPCDAQWAQFLGGSVAMGLSIAGQAINTTWQGRAVSALIGLVGPVLAPNKLCACQTIRWQHGYYNAESGEENTFQVGVVTLQWRSCVLETVPFNCMWPGVECCSWPDPEPTLGIPVWYTTNGERVLNECE